MYQTHLGGDVIPDSILLLILSLLLLLQLTLLYRQISQRRELRAEHERQTALIERQARVAMNQMIAFTALRDRLDLRQGFPYTPDWSAAPDFLQLLVEHALRNRPTLILECGSGLSSLMLARCCQSNGLGQLHSLENGADYAEVTRAHLQRYDLAGYATIHHAPLREQRIADQSYQWYALDDIPQQPIDMLVIDGPPGFLQRHARYPALPLLFDRLADDAVIFLDDAGREDELEIVELWKARYPRLQHEFVRTQRGCAILRLV